MPATDCESLESNRFLTHRQSASAMAWRDVAEEAGQVDLRRSAFAAGFRVLLASLAEAQATVDFLSLPCPKTGLIQAAAQLNTLWSDLKSISTSVCCCTVQAFAHFVICCSCFDNSRHFSERFSELLHQS